MAYKVVQWATGSVGARTPHGSRLWRLVASPPNDRRGTHMKIGWSR
jgi:hypothetical protein